MPRMVVVGRAGLEVQIQDPSMMAKLGVVTDDRAGCRFEFPRQYSYRLTGHHCGLLLIPVPARCSCPQLRRQIYDARE